MKKILFTIIIGFLTIITNAQEKENALSNAEIFSETTGTLIQKEFLDIGNLKKCNIQTIHFTDLISSKEKSAIKFEYEIAKGTSTKSKATYVDSDEVEMLLKSIKLMQDKINSKKPANYTEVYFRSRGGFETGCLYGDGGWTTYLIVQNIDGERYVWISIADLAILYTMIEQAKEKL